jgi:hypothetical protein
LTEIGTTTLIGGSLDTPTQAGGRFTLGFGDLLHCGVGIETTFFFLGATSKRETASSDSNGVPALFSPFFLPDGTGVARAIAFPGLLAGTARVEQTSRMWGIEANVRHPLLCDCEHKLDLLAGLRFIELNERLNIERTSLCILPGCEGQIATVTDIFGTRNRFYGGQVGLDYEYRHGRWTFGATGKVAIGDMLETVGVSGLTTATPGTNAVPGPVGLLAQPSNIGQHSRDHFAVVPELGLKIGYQVNDNLSVFAGYSLLYMSDVLRPGEQIDLVVDSTGKLARPRVPLNGSSLWVQGFNAGVEWRY